jgi:membrane protease YdiL (CAAX protease family)
MEELLFRGIVYNKIKEDYKPMKSIIIASIIFALFHFSNPLNVLYAFVMPFMFIYLYEKYKTLLAPISLHCIANTTTILTMSLIVKNIIWLNIIIILIMIATLIIINKLVIKKDLK